MIIRWTSVLCLSINFQLPTTTSTLRSLEASETGLKDAKLLKVEFGRQRPKQEVESKEAQKHDDCHMTVT